MCFKSEHSFENRIVESFRMLNKHPDRVPVICERVKNSKVKDIDKKKYLIIKDLTMGQFMYVIRKRLVLNPEESIFLFVNGKILSNTLLIDYVYNFNKDKDGFLYISYSQENTFG